MEGGGSTSVRVFDGTTDFRVWRARVENELMRYHLLGYVMVRGYDGSQAFRYNGEEVPPRTPMIHVDDEQQQQQLATLKEEASCGRSTVAATQQGRLSRWDVLGESAEAKSILQRFLHPDVECAILNKNIYDSWKMLCALYGNRSNPGAHDVNEMHRVLHHIRLGDKKGEHCGEFITRWEMLMQQYALATGIELTDGFRSVSLVQTLPSAWRPMVSSWRGIRPFVPYAELVEKVIATREHMQPQTEATSVLNTALVKSTSNSTNRPLDMQVAQLPKTPTDKSAAVKPVAQSISKPPEKTADKLTAKPAEKQMEKPAEERAAESPRRTEKTTKPAKALPPPISVVSGENNTVDLTSGELSTASSSRERQSASRAHSQDTTKKSPTDRSDRASTPRPIKSPRVDVKSNAHGKHGRYGADRGYDKYASYSRYEKSPRKSRSRYEGYNNYGDNKNGPVSCFYCLKVGHHMKRCWYLSADIENGTTHDIHKKFSCAVTIDRNQYMVNCLDSYIDEVNRERAAYGGSKTTTTPRNHSDYAVSESAGRTYLPKQKEFVPPPPPGQPPSYALHDSSTNGATDYRKRTRSVFQTAEDCMSSRDPRLNRSRSVYRSAGAADEFSPRKRRAPSFERQVQSYY